MRQIGSAIVVCVLFASVGAAAPAPWLEVKSQHFTIVTNSGEKEARRTAWKFEQVRQALKVIWPWAAVDGGRPITVFAVRDENTLKTLGPQFWEGKGFRPSSFWVGDSDRTYIALRTDVAEPDDVGENPYRMAYWCYVSAVLHRSLPVRAPEWYARGMTEVLSNTIVREKELHVGRLMNAHLRTLYENAPIPLDEFLGVDYGSKYLTREGDARLFEAQAWAFAHYMMFGANGAHRAQLNRFNQLLLQGTSADVALKKAFGGDLAPVFSGMREYIKRRVFQYGRIAVAVDLRPEGFDSRPLSAGETSELRSRLLVAMGRPVEARTEAAFAAAADPASPVPSEIEGALLDREGKPSEARAAFLKAVSLSSTRSQVYFRLAQLSRPPAGADHDTNEKIARLLERAIELEPDYANALSYLAETQSDLGKPEAGIELASRAVKLEPNEAYHRMALAGALWNARRGDEAVVAAQSALAVADDDQERARVQGFLDFAARSRQTPRPATPSTRGPATTTPEPEALVTVSGILEIPENEPPEAQAALGKCLTEDDAQACGASTGVLDKMCRGRDGYACRILGSFYDRGHGVPMGKAMAASAYQIGCTTGNDQQSCGRYAVLQAQGLGVRKDPVTALATLQKLCGAKLDDACLGWGLLLASGVGGRDIPKARSLFQASCSAGNPEGCRLLETVPPR